MSSTKATDPQNKSSHGTFMYIFPVPFLFPLAILYLLPPSSSLPSLMVPFFFQFVVVNWPREDFSCGKENTCVRWITSVSTGLAASAARTSSKERWCLRWERLTTPAALSAPPASKKLRHVQYNNMYNLVSNPAAVEVY